MNIFITGATGFIGNGIARAMRNAGHTVYGLTRSKDKVPQLAKEEIHPVIGNMNNSENYRSIAEQCSVLIHAAADYQNDTVELDAKTVQTFINLKQKNADKKIIYTSGCWIHGNTGDEAVDENSPLKPIEAVQWRPKVEQTVLNAGGIIVRPGCVYGRRGGLTAAWFDETVNQNSLSPVGDGTNYWSLNHVDDLADAYQRIAERDLEGELFNIADDSRLSVGDMVRAVAKAADYDGEINYVPVEEATKEMGPMAEALAINQKVDASKAKNMLNWEPRHPNFVDDIETYFNAWKALNN